MSKLRLEGSKLLCQWAPRAEIGLHRCQAVGTALLHPLSQDVVKATGLALGTEPGIYKQPIFSQCISPQFTRSPPVPSPRPCPRVSANWCQCDHLVPKASHFSTSPAYILAHSLNFLLCTIALTNSDGSKKESEWGNPWREKKQLLLFPRSYSQSSEAQLRCNPYWL